MKEGQVKYMESVMIKIQQAREDEIKKRIESKTQETTVNGCHVRIRFATNGDSKVLSAVKAMLIAAHLDTAFAVQPVGKCT